MTEKKFDFGFIHVPKTAGVSIHKSFRESGYELLYHIHKPYVNLSYEDKQTPIFFSVVRNPFDRIYSFYHFFLSENPNRKFLLGLEKDYTLTFSDFISKLSYFHNYIKPCWNFISESDQNKMTDTLKFETLHEDFSYFADKYQLRLELPWIHLNEDKPKIDRSQIYKEYQIKIIEKIYNKDFQNFGYSYKSWVESDSLIS
jgi:hypothetical protein